MTLLKELLNEAQETDHPEIDGAMKDLVEIIVDQAAQFYGTANSKELAETSEAAKRWAADIAKKIVHNVDEEVDVFVKLWKDHNKKVRAAADKKKKK